jgi:hypothetical protein
VEHYVFLRADGRTSLDDVLWPAPDNGEPGAWLDHESGVPAGSIRACPPEELVWWLDDELWAADLEGDLRREGHAVLGSRARLLSRVETWTSQAADELVEACALRVRDVAAAALNGAGRVHEARSLTACDSLATLDRVGAEIAERSSDTPARLAGFASDTALYSREAPDSVRGAAVAAYIAAHALAGGDKTVAGYEAKFADERRWQAEWLSKRLGLDPESS